jgi:hypothetical protein
MHNLPRKCSRLWKVFGAVAVAAAPNAASSAGATLEELIENVRGNEALYADLDVSLKSSYAVVGPPDQFIAPSAAVVSLDSKIKYVRQGKFFRMDRSGKNVDTEMERSMGRVRAYDGEKTRVHDENTVANIIDRPVDDSEVVRPHMFLLRYGGDGVIPLSLYLSGSDAVKKGCPDRNWGPDQELVAAYKGEKVVDGLACHTVAVTRQKTGGGAEHSRTEFDLAEERNYIPLRMRHFNYMYSHNLAWVEAQMLEMREIEKGTWFPWRAEVRGYDPIKVSKKNEQKLKTKQEYQVLSLSLHPDYDIGYFRDIVFPPGTAVYEIEEGKIKRSYRQGAPGSNE